MSIRFLFRRAPLRDNGTALYSASEVKSMTIAALATAPFRAAIGVIRMSGPQAFSIARSVLRYQNGALIEEGQRRNVSFARIVDGDEVIDEAVVCSFRGPYSYTGEDTVEFSCHGGVYLLQRVLCLLFDRGARQAEGGEFTKRAFLNGKSDLTRAEGVMDLIDSEYAGAARVAMGELDGTVGRVISEIRDELLGICAKLLAYVDYPDDEIGEVSTDEIAALLDTSLQRVTALCDSYEAGRILREGIRTALCGRPNVGKSSLMNRMAGIDRSIVTDVAGTTRDTVEIGVVFGDVKLVLTDTAGIRETRDVVEQIGVSRARDEMKKAELILCVFAPDCNAEDETLAEGALQSQGKTIFLFNKSDLAPQAPLPPWADRAPAFRVSAKTAMGMDAVADFVKTLFTERGSSASTVISNGRQYQCLCRVKTALQRARQNLALTPDVIVSDLEQAVAAVGEITGQTVSEQVIREIFSRFCVGK